MAENSYENEPSKSITVYKGSKNQSNKIKRLIEFFGLAKGIVELGFKSTQSTVNKTEKNIKSKTPKIESAR